MAQGYSRWGRAAAVVVAVLAVSTPALAAGVGEVGGEVVDEVPDAPNVARRGAPGEIDVEFGVGGSVAVPGSDVGSVSVDGEGRAVVLSTAVGAAPTTVSVSRFGTDGSPDPSFGEAGTVTAVRRGLAHRDDVRAAVDSDGRIVVASVEERSARLALVVRRLGVDGERDPTFGSGAGEVVEPLLSTIADVATVTDVAVVSDGDVVVGAVSSRVAPVLGERTDLGVLVRLDPAGALVGSTFTSLAVEDRSTPLPLDRVAVDPQGRTLVGAARGGDVTVSRYTDGLDLDPTFGTGGTVALSGAALGGPVAGPVVVRPFVGGTVVAGDGFVLRLVEDGSLDPGWAGGSPVTWAAGEDRLVDVAVRDDGGVLAVTAPTGEAGDGHLHGLDADGVPDPTLGGAEGVALVGLIPTGPVAVDGDRVLVVGATADGPAVRAIGIPSSPSEGGDGEVLVSVAPCRVVDTRFAVGRLRTEVRSVSVRSAAAIESQGGRAGGCAVPEEASSVMAAVSAVDPTAVGFLRVGAGTATPPSTTFVTHAVASQTNVGLLALGEPGDDLGVQAFGGTTHLVIDVFGYSIPTTEVAEDEGSVFVPVTPCRVLDDRLAGPPLLPGGTRTVAVDGDLAGQGGAADCGVPDDATGVEVAVSTVDPVSGGYARVGPAGGLTATVLNGHAGRAVTTTTQVGLGRSADGALALDLRVEGIRSSWVLDVTGYLVPRTAASASSGLLFHPAEPCRLVDTRRTGGRLSWGDVLAVAVDGDGAHSSAQGGAAGCGAPDGAVAANVTVSAVDPGAKGYLRLAPSGTPATAGTVVQHSAGSGSTGTASIGLADGSFDVHLAGGDADVVVELQGWYLPA